VKERLCTDIAEKLAMLRVVVDRKHYKEHTDCKKQGKHYLPMVNPDTFEAMRDVNSSSCEAFFSWVTKLTYVSLNMGQGGFHVFLYLILHEHNMAMSKSGGKNLQRFQRKKEGREELLDELALLKEKTDSFIILPLKDDDEEKRPPKKVKLTR